MFGRKPTAGSPVANLSKERFATILGANTAIKGDLRVAESIRIDGHLEGNATRNPDGQVSVVVGAGGQVTGDISATRVVVAGTVRGNIHADEDIELQDSAVVEGDLHCRALRVAHGAQLLCRVVTSAPPASNGRPVLVVDQGEPTAAARRSA